MKGGAVLRSLWTTGLLLGLICAWGGSAAGSEPAHHPAAGAAAAGYDGLVIGVPNEDFEGIDEGGVHVLYGSEGGVTTAGNQWFSQASPGLPAVPENDDFFGMTLATGDFNGDGYADLAVGVPSESFETINEGGVHVLYGSSGGVTTVGNQWFSQATPGLPAVAEESDNFGWTLASGDFDGDGYADLVIGVPFEDFDGVNEGGVHVLYGSAEGVTTAGNQWFSQATPGLPAMPEDDDAFGYALATGDFDGDGYADLVIGVPFEDFDGIDEGGVHVLYGSSGGVTTAGNQWFSQASPELPAVPEDDDYFGLALASGDFDGDGYADLAIGVPDEDFETRDEGGVHVLYGSAEGVTSAGNQWFSQATPDLPAVAEMEDRFGSTLASSDFDGDGYADLAIGVPWEDFDGINEGGVHVLYGSAGGVTTAGNQWFSQATPGLPTMPEDHDFFGLALATGDFDGDGYADLVIGVPYEDFETSDEGGVHVLYGSAGGVSTAGNQWFSQATPELPAVAEAGDHFGWSLAVLAAPRQRIYLPLVRAVN